ncbi:hypothetical protein XELAEV_18018295mg [Xenopus laevis]|uniref:Uncharacterized protein n=1 Tax=Xenopus laevis TaxID=8355 RepID=A0A974DD76_XENLA|nr:hypothetical protein XELAEV_18018295mg [Xenopus laevis]
MAYFYTGCCINRTLTFSFCPSDEQPSSTIPPRGMLGFVVLRGWAPLVFLILFCSFNNNLCRLFLSFFCSFK